MIAAVVEQITVNAGVRGRAIVGNRPEDRVRHHLALWLHRTRRGAHPPAVEAVADALFGVVDVDTAIDRPGYLRSSIERRERAWNHARTSPPSMTRLAVS